MLNMGRVTKPMGKINGDTSKSNSHFKFIQHTIKIDSKHLYLDYIGFLIKYNWYDIKNINDKWGIKYGR